MIRRLAMTALAALAALGVGLGFALPTDRLVRTLVARLPLPADHAVTFREAHLRPWGLVLDDLAYRRPDGTALVETDWVRIRPSWSALWRDRLGRPWHVAAGVFGGSIDARIGVDGAGRTLDASWTDIDVGSLLDALGRDDPLTGHTDGRAAVQLPESGTPGGAGEVTLRAAAWQPPLPTLEDVTLHADTATARWALADRRLVLAALDLAGPEMDATMRGHVDLVPNLGASTLDLEVVITPMPAAPRALRRLLDGLPRDAAGATAFCVTGALDAPRAGPR